MNSTANESLLILSDVHLGNDLNDLTPAGVRRVRAGRRGPRESARRTTPHAACAGSDGAWSSPATSSTSSAWPSCRATAQLDTEAERRGARARPGQRLRPRAPQAAAVAERHRVVFEALAAFVARGHALTIVHGNHDVEFHWDGVKDELAGAPRGHGVAAAASRTRPTRGDFAARIEFAPWFLLRGRRRLRRARPPVRHALLHRARDGAPLAARSAAHRAELLRRAPALGRAPHQGRPGVRPRAAGRPRLRHDGRAAGLRGLVRLLARFVGAWSSSSGCAARTSPRPRTRCARSTSGAWRRWRDDAHRYREAARARGAAGPAGRRARCRRSWRACCWTGSPLGGIATAALARRLRGAHHVWRWPVVGAVGAAWLLRTGT